MKNLIFLASIVAFSFQIHAIEDNTSCPTSSCRAGELVTLKLVPKDKHLTVQLAGKKAADFKWTDVGLEAYVIVAGNVRPLKVVKGGSGYEIREQIERPAQLRFDIKSRGQQERIELPLK